MTSIENPYGKKAGCRWLKGNLHAHTHRSDGRFSPQAVIATYAAGGYDFLMISDHDMIGPAGCTDADLDAMGLILIPGNEITARGGHLLHVGSSMAIEPSQNRQAVIAAAARVSDSFTVVNHPNIGEEGYDVAGHWPADVLERLQGFSGIEIYNGYGHETHGGPYALDKWDFLLSRGRRVWGFANDDFHSDIHFGRGWNMVLSTGDSWQDVVAALRKGAFYASTGVVIDTIDATDTSIGIVTENAQAIVALGDTRQIARADGRCLEVAVPPDIPYVRFECWGRGESFAWTQPFFVHSVD